MSSTALIGFGPDSVIEVASAAAVAWQFVGAIPRRGRRWPYASLRSHSLAWRPTSRSTPSAPFSALVKPNTHRSASPWRRSAWLSCRCSRTHSAEPGANSDRCQRWRTQTNTAVHVPVGGVARWPGAQQPLRLGVGRPHRRSGHRRHRAQGGNRCVEGRDLLSVTHRRAECPRGRVRLRLLRRLKRSDDIARHRAGPGRVRAALVNRCSRKDNTVPQRHGHKCPTRPDPTRATIGYG